MLPTRTFQSIVEPSTDDVANMVPCGENRMHVTPYLWPVSGEYDMSTYPSPALQTHTRTVLSLQHRLSVQEAHSSFWWSLVKAHCKYGCLDQWLSVRSLYKDRYTNECFMRYLHKVHEEVKLSSMHR